MPLANAVITQTVAVQFAHGLAHRLRSQGVLEQRIKRACSDFLQPLFEPGELRRLFSLTTTAAPTRASIRARLYSALCSSPFTISEPVLDSVLDLSITIVKQQIRACHSPFAVARRYCEGCHYLSSIHNTVDIWISIEEHATPFDIALLKRECLAFLQDALHPAAVLLSSARQDPSGFPLADPNTPDAKPSKLVEPPGAVRLFAIDGQSVAGESVFPTSLDAHYARATINPPIGRDIFLGDPSTRSRSPLPAKPEFTPPPSRTPSTPSAKDLLSSLSPSDSVKRPRPNIPTLQLGFSHPLTDSPTSFTADDVDMLSLPDDLDVADIDF